MYRSRIFIAAFALAGAAIAAVTATASRGIDCAAAAWRFTVTAAVDFGRWLVAKVPKVKPDWLARGWHRLHGAMGMLQLRHQATERRPLVCPRWRMCPST